MAMEDEFDPNAERIRQQNAAKSTYDGWIAYLAKQEGKSEEALMKSVLLETARNVAKKYEQLWLTAINTKNQILKASIVRNAEGEVIEKHPVPDNYWQAEHTAHTRYNNALEFLKAIEEG